MQRIGIISDLHLEFRNIYETEILLDKINNAECDIIVIAGDLHTGSAMGRQECQEFLNTINKPFIYVKGNHDFYRSHLHDHKFEQGDFVAATLWTNFRKDPIFERLAGRSINDFKIIDFCSTQNVRQLHDDHCDFISKSNKKLVVTHFPPTTLSCAPMYDGDPLNAYFINDKDALLVGKTLWICGHTHWKHEYILHGCTVVCNPLGYPGENYSSVNEYQVVIKTVDDAFNLI